jgi:SWIM zinc finger
MIAMKEVTDWLPVYNHTYLFDGTKAVAYIKSGEKKPIYFSKPLNIDRRGRKFVEVKNNPFKKKLESNLIKIMGSKGNVYHVDPELKTCTCTGFQFHGNCKHLKSALEEV